MLGFQSNTALRFKGSFLVSSNHRISLNQIVAFPFCLGQTLGDSTFLPPFLMGHICECICFRLSHAVCHGEQQQQLPLLPYNTSTIQSTTFWRTAIYLIFYLTFNDGFHYAQSGIPQHKTLLISLPRLAFYMICLNVTWS